MSMLACTPGRLALIIPLVLAGCQPPPARHTYAVLAGEVLSCHPRTGELTMRAAGALRRGDDTVYCVLTQDSEIYINDRFSAIDAISIGDSIELVGYRDARPPLERFVVSFAHVARAEPMAPAPLRAQAEKGASRPAPASREAGGTGATIPEATHERS